MPTHFISCPVIFYCHKLLHPYSTNQEYRLIGTSCDIDFTLSLKLVSLIYDARMSCLAVFGCLSAESCIYWFNMDLIYDNFISAGYCPVYANSSALVTQLKLMSLDPPTYNQHTVTRISFSILSEFGRKHDFSCQVCSNFIPFRDVLSCHFQNRHP